ncbi:MAG: hypothetical protein M3495_03680 [Pseudomonadota bacterium]|nr:hypothetical protein [Gammaproteobacteria bacterium]MDQ3580760.1 hypothetical protein [Pseudomonadota bacterium]
MTSPETCRSGRKSPSRKDWTTADFTYPYDATDGREDLEAAENVYGVLRGGGFSYGARDVRCAGRYMNYPPTTSLGFRVVVRP